MSGQNPRLPVFAIDRHRLTTDGVGVTTLVGAYGCPLACRYCINPHAWNPHTLQKCKELTPKELYEQVRIDELYFLATGGGITFGGGESLLHADFIRAFREVCSKAWHLTAETSLQVSKEQLLTAIETVDSFIVDIKDMNPGIYEAYTGRSADRMLENLTLLSQLILPDRIRIRVPMIPDYNTEADRDLSVKQLKEMGFTQIEVFPYILA